VATHLTEPLKTVAPELSVLSQIREIKELQWSLKKKKKKFTLWD
jgi:hypothetical protein